MEVLHDLRPRCGAVVRRLTALLLGFVAGCGGGDRQGLTADSAVLQPGATAADTSAAVLSTATDSGLAPFNDDTTDLQAGPRFVLVGDSAAGDVLFRRKGKCLSCHGLAGKGIEGLGPNLQDTVWLHGDGSFAFIQRTIMEGIARPKVTGIGMPAFARAPDADASASSTTLSPEEIYHITAYVYALSHPGSAVADTTSAAAVPSPPRDTTPPPPPLQAAITTSRRGTHSGR